MLGEERQRVGSRPGSHVDHAGERSLAEHLRHGAGGFGGGFPGFGGDEEISLPSDAELEGAGRDLLRLKRAL